MAKDSFQSALNMVNSGKPYPVIKLIREDPGMAAVISKLVTPPIPPTYNQSGNREPLEPSIQMFKGMSDHISQSITDAETVMKILPDMELSAQILISSIISPKDMTSTELIYSVKNGILTPDVTAALIARTSAYFEEVYKITGLLPAILKDMLFMTGSYAVAVIPENTIDEVINGSKEISLESLSVAIKPNGEFKSLGLLGPTTIPKEDEIPKKGIAIESLKPHRPSTEFETSIKMVATEGVFDTYIDVTDNFNLLKMPSINSKIRERKILDTVGGAAFESIQNKHRGVNDKEITNLIYKTKNFGYQPITVLKTQEQLSRSSIGNPLVTHIPSEAVIPVFIPGNMSAHVGYFILIDGDGHPISKMNRADYSEDIGTRLQGGGSFPSAMLARVKSMVSGYDGLSPRLQASYSAKAYGSIIEQDLLARLRNGVYGNGVALAKREDVYQIMLSRTLAKKRTQLLFVPVELMTYFAFEYNDQGIGRSLLEDMKILNSLRAMLLFANVMASLRNSIGRTEVKIKLDSTDPSPQKTIEVAMAEIVRSRQHYFPIGINSPTDIVDYLQKAGFEFSVEGHPGIPDVAVDFGEKASSYVKPDEALEDSLRKRGIQGLGLNTDVVDAGLGNAEFAASIINNNLLFAKRVMQKQEALSPLLTEHLRKCMMNSEKLITDLRGILSDNFDKLPIEKVEQEKEATETDKEIAKHTVINEFLNQYIVNFTVSLPAPNTATLENQVTSMETYTKALDLALDAWISDKFFTDQTGSNVAAQVTTIKEVLKAYFLRKWMNQNGVMTELSALTTTGEEGKASMDVYEIQSSHLSALTKTLTKFMVSLQDEKEKSNETLDKLGVSDEPPASSSDESPPDDGGIGGDFGPDDLDIDAAPSDNIDVDVPADDAPADTPPADDENEDDKKSDEVPKDDVDANKAKEKKDNNTQQ